MRSRSTRFSVTTISTFGSALASDRSNETVAEFALDAEPFQLGGLPRTLVTAGSILHARLANLERQPRAFFLELRRVARIGDERLAVERHEQITVVAGEAGEIRYILEIGDQQRSRPWPLESAREVFCDVR